MTARDRTILMVVGALAVLAGFWFLALKPKHAQAQAAAAQTRTQQQRLQTAEQTVAAGLQAKSGHADDVATLAQLGKALPADDDMPSLLYTLDASARGAHVQFNSLARSGGSGTTSSSTASAGTGSTTTPSTGAATATAALPPGAVVGTAGLATLPFTFTFQGSYFDLKRLLADVHGFVRTSKDTVAVRGRLLTIDGVALAPDTDSLSKITAKVVATAYLSPSSDGTATSGSTAPAATAAPSSTAITATNR